MFRALLSALALACVLALGIPTGSAAPAGDPQLSKIGKATKEAGEDIAKGTKKVAKKTVKETKNVGKTVEGAVTPGMKSVRCKDDTVQTVKSGQTKAYACRRHLGVKK